MRPIIQEIQSHHTPESLGARLQGQRGLVILRSATMDPLQGRYSYVAAQPFLTFASFGSRCEVHGVGQTPRSPAGQTQFGNPFRLLEALMGRYELLDEMDLPFPLGGCFGYWGYELKNFVEPCLARRAVNDLELPDCHLGFYDSLVAFDHWLGKTWIVSTGMTPAGNLDSNRSSNQVEFWRGHLEAGPAAASRGSGWQADGFERPLLPSIAGTVAVASNLTRDQFIAKVNRAKDYIRAGDIYQVNLSQRLTAETCPGTRLVASAAASHTAAQVSKPALPPGIRLLASAAPSHGGGAESQGWDLFQRLCEASPAPFAAFLDCGPFQLCSSSPESFLRFSGWQVQTRPIKGTRPRSADSARDAQLTYELQTSPKEMAELIMITDLLRNDLGRVCEFGSIHVPELVRLERYAQVQHLVSTIAGRLRAGQTHLSAFAACFPGGSVTGAPKIRAMEIIDELEPVTRGPYTGALGYLGFNRESQLSIAIRTAICHKGKVHFQVGAGIVADSIAEAEYEETLAKAAGFFEALKSGQTSLKIQTSKSG